MNIRRFFRPPTFADEEQTQRAQMLHYILWSLLLVFDTQFIIYFFLMPQQWQRWLAIVLTFNFTLPPLLLLNRRGYTRLSGLLLLTELFVMGTILALTAHGIHSLAILMFIVFVLIAGLVFGGRGGLLAAMVFSIAALGFVLLETAGYLPKSQIFYTAISIWVLVVICLEFIAIFQFLANRSIRNALEQARQNELALRERKQRYREVFDTTSDSIFLLDVTTDGRFPCYQYNPACERVIGLTTAEVAGKTPEQIFPPGMAQAVTANYQRCVAQGSQIDYEEDITGVHGRSYCFHTTLIPVKNDAGRIFRIVGVAHDVTERKAAEAALRESEERYREVFETTSDLIFLLDVTADGRFLGHLFNPAWERAFGLKSAEIAGKTPEQIVPLDEARIVTANFKRCVAQGSTIDYEETLTGARGKRYCFHTTLIPVKDADGRVFRIVGVAHDVTERKEMEAALIRSRDELETRVQERTAELRNANARLQQVNHELQGVNQELEAFSYSVSHDLRRPVRTVTGFTELLMADYARNLPEDARSLLTITRESAQQMNQLIEALLHLSRIERQPLIPRPVNLTALARRTVKELQAENPGRKMDIRVAELPESTGDPDLLQQVFVNLLSNAIKYSRDRAVALIEVGFKCEDGKIIYFVRDNGAGFDMRYADKLFGVFQRLHSAEQFKGTGVGLSIVRRIIHRHGGEIWAHAAVDQGATFYFTLPGVPVKSDAATMPMG